jgi:hypothetical protein
MAVYFSSQGTMVRTKPAPYHYMNRMGTSETNAV